MPLKTTHWQIRDTYRFGCELWEHIMAADRTVWVIHIETHTQGPLSGWTQTANWAFASQIATFAVWIPHRTGHGSTSTIRDLAQSKENSAFLMQRPPLYAKVRIPAIDDPFVLRWGGPHCMGCYLYKLLADWTNWSFSRLLVMPHCLIIVDTF